MMAYVLMPCRMKVLGKMDGLTRDETKLRQGVEVTEAEKETEETEATEL